MLYQALATDYDGTIATEGRVDETTYSALERWQQTGRKWGQPFKKIEKYN